MYQHTTYKINYSSDHVINFYLLTLICDYCAILFEINQSLTLLNEQLNIIILKHDRSLLRTDLVAQNEYQVVIQKQLFPNTKQVYFTFTHVLTISV